MATKRKIMAVGSSPAVSSPATKTPVSGSPAVRTPVVGSPAVGPPNDDFIEHDEEELNMSDDEEGGTRIGEIYIPPPVKPYCSTESIGPRLIITKISNCNFKSYAGVVVLGPFSNCFHAIIGPNGSGKSNVIDSMLFVFGYRANKIRCKKLSVLIHKSSAHENINSCSVAVHFEQIVDKPDGSYEFVKGSAFVISRTAFRDNTSYYTINNQRVHFKEVAKMLKQHGVDLDHNRFLILQGEVESIAMMKPKGATENECGLLEYLEDIVGTTRYKDPLQKINSRVEILTEESTDKHNRCKMAQREMDDLNAPKDQAIEYINMENDRTRTQNLYFQKMMFEKNVQLQDLQQKQSDVVTELKEHDDKYAEINRIRLEKEKLIEDEMKHYDKLLKSKEEHEQRVAAAMRKVDSVKQTMESVNKQRKQYKAQIKKEEEKLVELKKIPAKNASEIAESETKIEKLTAEKTKIEEQLEKNLETLQEQTQPLIEKKEKLQTELLGYQTKVDECKAAFTVSSNELKIVQHSELSERQKYNTWKASLEESKTEYEEKKGQLKEMQSDLPEAKQASVKYKQQLEELAKEENALTVQLRKLRSEVDEKNRAMRAAQSNNKIVDSLMKLRINGAKGFEGVLGRLGDLGGIDAKYDIAISTCCGRLENIVVDTVDTAQRCIKYLSDNKLGRATFIALEKMNRPNPRGQYPENVHRLYDLIRVEDERVRSAFYFALRETLVADDIEQASRIAYGSTRYRTVTLKGELIETSGSMSGGGRPIRGRMGQQVKTKTSRNDANTSMSADNITEMNLQVEELSNKISYCQEQQGQLERDLRNVEVSIKQKETAIKRLTTEVNSLEKSLPQVEQQCEAQRQRMEATKSDPAKVKELESIIKTNDEALKVSEAEAKKIKDKVSEVEKKIKSITAEKVKSLETKIDDLGKQIAKLSKNVSRLKVEVTTSERNCVKTQESIDNLNKEVVNAQEQIIAKNHERDEAYKEIEELKEKVKEIEDEINRAQSGGTEIKKEIQKLQQEEQQGKVLRVDIEQKLQAIEKLVNDVKEQLPRLKHRLKGLKLREIPKQDAQELLKVYQDEELSTHKTKDLEYKISCLDEQIQATATPNIGAIEEYYTRREVYLERVRVLEDITKKRNEMRHLYDEVRKRRHNEFKEGFNIITRKLREMYQMITQGGDAELELVDSMDPFTEGVSFSVRPPKKTWKNISNLSGGEKTLSSLALVFALHYYKPSPLYFMDEIDAALDFKNVSIVANYIRERTRNAQFIIISLRTNMFELSHCLTGIYKVHDCTQSLSMSNTVPEYCLPPPSSQTCSQAVEDSLRPSQAFGDYTENCEPSAAATQQSLTVETESENIILRSSPNLFDDILNGSGAEPMEVS